MIIDSNRIAVIGDIHAQHQELEIVVDFFRKKEISTVLCTGDIVDGDGDVNKCFKILIDLKIEWVLGNHDEWLLTGEMRDLPDSTKLPELSDEIIKLIKMTPKTKEFMTNKGLLLLCHGLGENVMGSLKPSDYGYGLECNGSLQQLLAERKYKFVIAGHSHQKMVRTINGIVFINPGALLPEKAGVSIIDFEEMAVTIFGVKNRSLVEEEVIRFKT